jgi:hypothetical protein
VTTCLLNPKAYAFMLALFPAFLRSDARSLVMLQQITGQTVYVSATPAPFELGLSTVIAEQVIRPTGLLDPEITLRPTKEQVEDLIGKMRKTMEQGERVLGVSGAGYQPTGGFLLEGQALAPDAALLELLRAGALCGDARSRVS